MKKRWILVAIVILALLAGSLANYYLLGSVARIATADDNVAFGNIQNLSSNDGNSYYPNVAASSNGNAYVAWVDETAGNLDVFFRGITDNGTTIGPVINLSDNPGLSGLIIEGDTSDPVGFDIAASGNNVYVAWYDRTEGNSYSDGHILFRSSNDSGTTFGTAVDLASAGLKSHPKIAVSPASGDVHVVWNSPNVLMKISRDNGATFGPTIVLSMGGSSFTHELAIAGSSLYVIWVNDCSVEERASHGNGASLGGRKIIYKDDECSDELDAQVAASGSNVYVAWKTSADKVMLRTSHNSGSSFGPVTSTGGEIEPDLATIGNNVYLVSKKKSFDYPFGAFGIYHKTSKDHGSTFGSEIKLSDNMGSPSDPTVFAKTGNVFVAWHDQSTGHLDVYFSASLRNNGKLFAPSINLSNNTGISSWPDIDTSGNNVFVVWSDNTLGNNDVYFRLGKLPVDTLSPDTKINSKLDGNGISLAGNGTTNSATAKFSFYGSDDKTVGSNLRFECSHDESVFSECTRPITYSDLSVGEHAFEVRAIDKAGNIDPTPAKFTWNVISP